MSNSANISLPARFKLLNKVLQKYLPKFRHNTKHWQTTIVLSQLYLMLDEKLLIQTELCPTVGLQPPCAFISLHSNVYTHVWLCVYVRVSAYGVYVHVCTPAWRDWVGPRVKVDTLPGNPEAPGIFLIRNKMSPPFCFFHQNYVFKHFSSAPWWCDDLIYSLILRTALCLHLVSK